MQYQKIRHYSAPRNKGLLLMTSYPLSHAMSTYCEGFNVTKESLLYGLLSG